MLEGALYGDIGVDTCAHTRLLAADPTLCGVTYVWCGEICRARVYMDGGRLDAPIAGRCRNPMSGSQNSLLAGIRRVPDLTCGSNIFSVDT